MEPRPEQLWYAAHPRLRTKTAADRAIATVDWVRTGRGLDDEPTTHALFVALHTCAFQAQREVRQHGRPNAACRRWISRWVTLREYIVEQNFGLVYAMIGRFRATNIDEDDLLSEALYALSRATERFNPWRGWRFSTYACNAIVRACSRQGKREARHRHIFPVQHDTTMEQPGPGEDLDTGLFVERLRRALRRNLGDLTEIESQVIQQRFLDDAEPRLTFKQIGQSVGLSKERIRQIQCEALDKLRDALRDDRMLR